MKLYKRIAISKDYQPTFYTSKDKLDASIFDSLMSFTIYKTNNNYISFFCGLNHLFQSHSTFEEIDYKTNDAEFFIEWLLQKEKKEEKE